MKLKEIRRTSTFAWSPMTSLPLLATGSVAGALDESFSNESQLEIWAPNFVDSNEFELGFDSQNGPKGLVSDTSRFNRLAWGYVDSTRPKGVLAAGMENGELVLWDPVKILEGAGSTNSLILRNTIHTGPVRGLDFNPIQTNLLSSGAVEGEIYIWDLKDPNKPYSPSPGSRSNKLDEITSVSWNQQVSYVLAGSSSTGYTIVWDLRTKREAAVLSYGGGAGTLAGQGAGMAAGGRRGMSDIAWHPDNATRLVTASEDDSSPIIMVWDLRNARAPEKILTGHEKGLLSLSWCKQDADLLLSCGKDNRALCWNPQTSEIIGELPSANNWAFQVEWCPRQPDLFAAAFFDGTIGIHSIQSTGPSNGQTQAAPKADGSDVFDAAGYARASQSETLSVKQPPKWLRRPASSSFGFGGKLVSISNLPPTQGKNHSSVVHIRNVTSEEDIISRAKKLREAIDNDKLSELAQDKATEEGTWKALLSLFRANSRDELVTLLGFSKTEIAVRVAEAISNLKAAPKVVEEDITEGRPRESVVSFAEPEKEVEAIVDTDHEEVTTTEKTPSEISVSVTSDATSGARVDNESTTTAPSLFSDDNEPGTPQMDNGADFFSTVGSVPHTSYPIDSSVAATIGSRASSVTSETLKSNGFRIYPADESETDRLITKALVLGDFESAVSLCLSTDRFADAILLAVKGGPELLERTQKAYFERQTATFPYLRLFQSIVTNDLADIVQNADLQEWQEIFVVLCTFASQEEFAGLTEQLGGRLEFQFTMNNEEEPLSPEALDYRKKATLAYLAAGRLERLVNIWAEELVEEEKSLLSAESATHYGAHALALQTFIEKVSVFRSAIKYVDGDLTQPTGTDPNIRTYKLANLYDKYFQYADILASQGLVKEAIAFLNLTPAEYKGTGDADLTAERERLIRAANVAPAPAPSNVNQNKALPSVAPVGRQYAPFTAPTSQPAPMVPGYAPSNVYPAPVAADQPYAPASTQPLPYAPSQPSTYQPAAPTYPGYNPLTQPPHLRPQPGTQPAPSPSMIPPPPRVGATIPAPPPSQPIKRDAGGWNDAPVIEGRSSSTKPKVPITSPLANVGPSPSNTPFMSPGQLPPSSLPPPPRPGSVQNTPMQPPPPRGPGGYSPQQTSPSTLPPTSRLVSPQQGGPQRQPTPSYAPPPPRGPGGIQTPPPPGPYARPPQPSGPPPNQPPPQQFAQAPPAPQMGSYAPPTSQTGPYAPPPGQHQPPAPPSGPYAPPAPPTGPYAPPPGTQHAPPPMGPGPSPSGPPQGPPRQPQPPSAARQPQGPPPPKYPPGDRTHIPDYAIPVFSTLSGQLDRLKQTAPANQKRLLEDLERRINPLFDALNCETLPRPIVDQLVALVRAMDAHDRPAALAIHVDILTRNAQTEDLGLWMSGVKQLIMRL